MAISDDDLDACFSTNDFGVLATLSVNGDEVEGYFTEGSDAAQQYGVEIEAIEPSFTARTSLLDPVTIKSTITINSVTYTVMRKQRVGTGVTVLYLKT